MSKYSNSAIYKVRKWLESELYASGVLTPDFYVGTSPVIPIQQIPETDGNDVLGPTGMATDSPFIVYDFVTPGGYDTDYWNRRDEVMFWIYDYDLEKVIEIRDFMYDLFGRFDLTAADINNFNDPGNPYQFQYFDVMMGLPTDEADQVLGRVGANIVVSYQYSRPVLSNGRFA
jgi:hypothetical protein